MKKSLFLSAVIAALLVSVNFFESKKNETFQYPHDWTFAQRAYPNSTIDLKHQLKVKREVQQFKNQSEQKLNYQWVPEGPTNISGRITDIAVDQTNNIIYTSAASGGIFKVTNNGQTVVPIFDNASALSVGALAIDPNNPSTLYAGTGEANAASNTGAFPGDGIYKSTDGGNTWNNVGLSKSYYIGRIAINPKNSNQIYAACMGKFWGTNPERGVYRSNDGGTTWTNVLNINDSTGCIDLVINPDH
ncbi:MAG: hypothetical protein MRY83_15180, partial [Flavobacteriales bacterium]|nr:hypothetical protein [Flavobacteriales bacterium]